MNKEKVANCKGEILKDLKKVDLIDEKKDLFKTLLDQSEKENENIGDFIYRLTGNLEIVEGKDSYEEYFDRPINKEDERVYMKSLDIYFL